MLAAPDNFFLAHFLHVYVHMRYAAIFIDDLPLELRQKYGLDYLRHDRTMTAACEVDADDKPVEILGWDGGEPEDLCRDWSWVIDALQGAYEDGKASRE